MDNTRARELANNIVEYYSLQPALDIRLDIERALETYAQQAEEPVAVRYGWDGHGYQYIDNGSGSDWLTRHKDGEPLYAQQAEVCGELVKSLNSSKSALNDARSFISDCINGEWGLDCNGDNYPLITLAKISAALARAEKLTGGE